MLSKADNELICRVGPDAPMGKAFRHYWLPVMLSSELPEPDSVPFPVEVCGERLVVFRDTKGALGALAEHCCHLGASLLLGRVAARSEERRGGTECVSTCRSGWSAEH